MASQKDPVPPMPSRIVLDGIDPELNRWIRERATANRRTLTAEVGLVLEEARELEAQRKAFGEGLVTP
jgi:hypothetical protein